MIGTESIDCYYWVVFGGQGLSPSYPIIRWIEWYWVSGGWVGSGTPYPYHVCDSSQLSGVEWELSKPSDLIISTGKSSQATTYSLSSESLRKQLTQWPHHNGIAQLHCNCIQHVERVPNFYNSRQQKSWVKTELNTKA